MKHVLLIDDEPDTREWSSQLVLDAFGDVTIVEADSLKQANDRVDQYPISLALVDIHLPDGLGVDFIERTKPAKPTLFCVVLTAFDDSEYIFAALKAGADGYLLKNHDKQRLVHALRDIMNGAPPLSPSIARRIIKHFRVQAPVVRPQKPAMLTQRETEALSGIAQGLTRKELAENLGIRPGTVAGYIKRVYEKLDINNRAQAALAAKRMGLI